MMPELNILLQGAGLFLTIFCSVISATWFMSRWVNNQFNATRDLIYSIRDLIYTKIEQTEKTLMGKLEFHERHDDQRFTELTNQIWEVKLKNAHLHKAKPITEHKD